MTYIYFFNSNYHHPLWWWRYDSAEAIISHWSHFSNLHYFIEIVLIYYFKLHFYLKAFNNEKFSLPPCNHRYFKSNWFYMIFIFTFVLNKLIVRNLCRIKFISSFGLKHNSFNYNRKVNFPRNDIRKKK